MKALVVTKAKTRARGAKSRSGFRLDCPSTVRDPPNADPERRSSRRWKRTFDEDGAVDLAERAGLPNHENIPHHDRETGCRWQKQTGGTCLSAPRTAAREKTPIPRKRSLNRGVGGSLKTNSRAVPAQGAAGELKKGADMIRFDNNTIMVGVGLPTPTTHGAP